jgi:hypothetical protein
MIVVDRFLGYLTKIYQLHRFYNIGIAVRLEDDHEWSVHKDLQGDMHILVFQDITTVFKGNE